MINNSETSWNLLKVGHNSPSPDACLHRITSSILEVLLTSACRNGSKSRYCTQRKSILKRLNLWARTELFIQPGARLWMNPYLWYCNCSTALEHFSSHELFECDWQHPYVPCCSCWNAWLDRLGNSLGDVFAMWLWVEMEARLVLSFPFLQPTLRVW